MRKGWLTTIQHPLWLYLLTHFKDRSCFVEGPLSNLQPSMIQFSKPRKTLASAMDPFRRFEAPAKEYMEKGKQGGGFFVWRLINAPAGNVPAPAASRFDPAYYRTHDAVSYIPSDSRSVVSQALTSNFPLFAGQQGRNKMSYSGYASSVISQQPDNVSELNGSHLGAINPSIASSQYDRLPTVKFGDKAGLPGLTARRRLSGGSMAQSDAASASLYGYGYKAGDDDTLSIAPSQAGVTDF
jgi:regulator of nonsense transcripts 1